MGHLILADPWGFPRQPKDIEASSGRRIPWYVKTLYHVFKHFNPLATLRLSGPWGPNAITRMRPELVQKFRDVFETDEQNMEIVPGYMYHCNAQQPR